jgi:hypothetical protein
MWTSKLDREDAKDLYLKLLNRIDCCWVQIERAWQFLVQTREREGCEGFCKFHQQKLIKQQVTELVQVRRECSDIGVKWFGQEGPWGELEPVDTNAWLLAAAQGWGWVYTQPEVWQLVQLLTDQCYVPMRDLRGRLWRSGGLVQFRREISVERSVGDLLLLRQYVAIIDNLRGG